MNIKKEIANEINCKFENVNFEELIIEAISADKGDFCLPCFSISKTLHQSPMSIANKIADATSLDEIIEKVEVVAGYVNFFLNKSVVASKIIGEFETKELFSSEGKNKVVCIDYGSPNLAKFLHIGHLKTLIVGEGLARLYAQFGYKVRRLNFIGDYGTPFGKIIGGLIKWGSMEDVDARGNDALQEYYVKFNQMEAEDESYSQLARDIFKKIEEKDKVIYPIYEKIIKIGLSECVKMFDYLGVKFDDYRGEMFYNQFVPKVIDILTESNLLIESDGAKIVDLSNFDMAPAVIVKSDGTSLYASRDLGAVIERYKDYKFDRMLYVTDVAQILHFKQWFKVIELLGYDYADKLEHVPYGRFSMPDGKISSRKGKQAVLADLLKVVKDKADEVIKDRTFTIENPKNVSDKVARAVLNYNVLKVERIKDCVFDIDKAFSFDGETAPYMQYTYTRLESILRKFKKENDDIDFSWITVEAFELIKLLNSFKECLRLALDKRDLSIICKKAMDICKIFNKFYATTKILEGAGNQINGKIALVKMTKEILNVAFNLICIDTLKEM